MDLEGTDLCPFCSDLIKATNDTQAHYSQRPHHPTYGLLLSSSKTCIVCQLIASQWDPSSSTLIRHGLSQEVLESSQQGYPVALTVEETRRSQSGVCWAFLKAKLETTNTPLSFISYFTVTACSSGGKEGRQPVLHLYTVLKTF